MSKKGDAERALDAESARNERAILVLEELLAIVKAKRDGVSMPMVAQDLARSTRTVFNRRDLLEKMLEMVESKGGRHT